MSSIQKIVDHMHAGNKKAIVDSIFSESPILVVNAIIEGVKNSVKDATFIDGVKKALNNNTELLGVKIANVAEAALDLLQVSTYEGNECRVIELIDSQFNF